MVTAAKVSVNFLASDADVALRQICPIHQRIDMHDGNRPLTQSEFEKNGLASVSREVERFHKLYPNLVNYVWATKLNGFHCVILPYFRPISKKERDPKGETVPEDERVLEGVRSVLEKLKNLGLRFAKEDILWRHIGKLEGKVHLFDLADLEKSESSTEVDDHIKALKEKLDEEVVPSPPETARSESAAAMNMPAS